jgi:hypothetical protein
VKRDVTIFKGEQGGVPGDPEAISRATALGNLLDDATLERLAQMFMTFDLIGGQAYIQARREKFDPAGNRIPADEVDDVVGEWQTVGYVIRYDSRDPRVNDRPVRAPDEVELIWPEEPDEESTEPEVLEEAAA